MKAKQRKAVMAKLKIIGYDVKKKKKAEMLNPKLVTMKNGRKAWKGTSALSGIGMFRIAKASEL